MMRSCLVLLAFVALPLAGCPGDPGELRPLFDEIVGLPGFDHPGNATIDAPPEEGWPRFERRD